MPRRVPRHSLLIAVTVSLMGCAAPPADPAAPAPGPAPATRPEADAGAIPTAGAAAPVANDPFEARNRAVFAANVRLDRTLGGGAPGGAGSAWVPTPLVAGITNVADLLATPRSVVNDVLQGRIEDAGHNAFRFALNATLGVGGLFDPATSFGLEERTSDFGQTLAVWGVDEGPYLVLPVIGPSTRRDVAGFAGDAVIDPLNFVLDASGLAAIWAVRLAEAGTDRLVYAGTIDGILYDSADPYIQARLLYLEKRRAELREPDADTDYFDPYEDAE